MFSFFLVQSICVCVLVIFIYHTIFLDLTKSLSIFPDSQQHDNENTTKVDNQNISNGHTTIDKDQEKAAETAKEQPQQQKKRRDVSAEREVTVKWNI